MRRPFWKLTFAVLGIFALYWGIAGTCGFRPDNLALISASVRGDAPEVRSRLRWGADPNARNIFEKTMPLGVAAREGHEEVVRILLAAGARPNVQTGDLHWKPPILWAAINGHSGVVRLLLDAGADPNLEGCERGTALEAAERRRETVMVKMLLQSGARHRYNAGGNGKAVPQRPSDLNNR